MTIREGKRQLLAGLTAIYQEREAKAIADKAVGRLTGLTRVQLLLDKDKILAPEQIRQLAKWQSELSRHRPIQYVLGEAWFMGLSFFVEEGVLIPRPETEELVHWILETMDGKTGNVLDIGTGSGCIAIAIAKHHPKLNVSALDKSAEALRIARQNNRRFATAVRFRQLDILSSDEKDFPEKCDLIVSNPPYVTADERKGMHQNVLAFEPEMALFVPDSEALLFYQKISGIAAKTLKNGGYLFFEINENFGKEVVGLLEHSGFSAIVLKKDLQGKDRIVKALWLVN